MDLLTIIKLAMSVFGKGSLVLKNPALVSDITKLVAASIILVEACSDSTTTGEQKQADAITVINLSVDLAEDTLGKLPDETNTFIKTELVPNTIKLLVTVFNSLRIFTKKTAVVKTTVVDNSTPETPRAPYNVVN